MFYAFLSMVFAGCTSVVAKQGLSGISSDLGVLVRTFFVFCFVTLFSTTVLSVKDLKTLSASNFAWLAVSAALTTASWIFYYRALKNIDVSTVALIDKGSVVVAVILAVLIFHESLTAAKVAGSALIVLGLVVIARG